LKIISLLVCLLAVGLLAGCGDDETKTVTQPAAAPAETTPATTTEAAPAPEEAMPEPSAMPEPPEEPSSGGGGDYPPGFGDKFAEGCASSGKLTESQCKCWFDELQKQYDYQEFLEVLQQAQSGSLPGPVEDALRKCINA
jgi:hypothetical protein